MCESHLSEFSHLAQQLGLPKIVSIQNAYNLTNRVFEINLAETCHFHRVGLMAYSTLAFGYLSGKYLSKIPKNSRLDLFPGFDRRYHKPNFAEAVKAYVDIVDLKHFGLLVMCTVDKKDVFREVRVVTAALFRLFLLLRNVNPQILIRPRSHHLMGLVLVWRYV